MQTRQIQRDLNAGNICQSSNREFDDCRQWSFGGAAMKQTLKSIFLFDAVSFLEFVPEIPHNFHVLVSLTIGNEGEAGGSDYSIGVCTPTWLDHHIQNTGPLSGRHLLIVNRFDAAEIRAHIEKIISQCEREDPAEANAVLGRFFAWEFEDYQP